MNKSIAKKMKQRSAGKPDIELGKRIRLRRVEQKISQAELGEQLGVSFQQVQKYEKGVNRVGAARLQQIATALGDLEYNLVRRNILQTKLRIDGRDGKTIRPIVAEVGILPRAHGSALFTRGETQGLVVATLGTAQDEQIMDELAVWRVRVFADLAMGRPSSDFPGPGLGKLDRFVPIAWRINRC